MSSTAEARVGATPHVLRRGLARLEIVPAWQTSTAEARVGATPHVLRRGLARLEMVPLLMDNAGSPCGPVKWRYLWSAAERV